MQDLSSKQLSLAAKAEVKGQKAEGKLIEKDLLTQRFSDTSSKARNQEMNKEKNLLPSASCPLPSKAKALIRKYKRHNKRDSPDAFYSWHETEILLQQYRQKQPSQIKPIAAKYRLITNGQQLKELLAPLNSYNMRLMMRLFYYRCIKNSIACFC